MSGSAFAIGQEGTLLANGREIANFAPKVVCGYWAAEQDGKKQLVAISIRFTIAGQSNEQTTTISYRDLNSFDFETEFPGCICSDRNGRSSRKRVIQYIREQISQCESSINHGVYYFRTGWHGQQFVMGDKVIGLDAQVPYAVEHSIKGISLAANPTMTPCEAAERLLSSLQRIPDVGLPTFSFTLFSSLRSIFRVEGLPTACILYLVGQQGFGKTTLAKSFCTLYNDADGQLMSAFEAGSTESSMRDALADARDRVILLDDVCKSTNPGTQRARRKLAAELVRAATSEIPIIRKRGRTTESVVCTASLVLTGEFPLEEPSDLTRCIMVEVRKQLTGGSAQDRGIATSALEGFLQWFSKNSGQERARLRKDYNNFRFSDRSHQEERLQISLWELNWVMSSFLRFAVEIGAVSEKAAAQIDGALAQELQHIFAATLQRIRDLSDRSLMFLSKIITIGAKSRQFPWFPHDGCLFVTSEALAEYLKQVTQRSDIHITDVAYTLKQQDLLRLDKSGKSTRKYKGIRYLTIPFDKLGLP